MRVTAVVVNWNGAGDLPGCVDALRAQDHRPLAVVVVDNASTDTSREVLEQLLAEPGEVPLEVRWNATNRGFAGAVNDVLATDDADAVLVCNPDVRPAPDHLRHLVAALADDPSRGAVQGRLWRRDPGPAGTAVIDTTGHVAFRTRLFRNRGEGEIDRGQWGTPGEVFGVSGALALYRRAMLDDVAVDLADRREWLDEDLFAFWEDVDLDWRAAMRGWTAWYVPEAVAHHERGGAGPRRTARVEQLNWQNRLLTLVKDDSWSAVRPALGGLLATTLLKTAELALTDPRALLAALRSWRLVGAMRAKRAQVHGRATVPTEQVVDRWFVAFDYRGWIRTWWRRVRGVPVGHEPDPVSGGGRPGTGGGTGTR